MEFLTLYHIDILNSLTARHAVPFEKGILIDWLLVKLSLRKHFIVLEHDDILLLEPFIDVCVTLALAWAQVTLLEDDH